MSEPGGDWPELESRSAAPDLPPGEKCRNHPDRPATAVCTECRAPVCDECAPLKGGGHVFCNSCMKNSRLVDAEPQIIGAPAEGEGRAAAEPSAAAPGPSRRRVIILIAIVLALLAAIAATLLMSNR